ncbi:polysaccharide biosynthesis protein [Planctomycetales bacterium]|nr:polysaccharide biosynthesis protein [Planctomycetales bacterium]
MSEKRTFLKHTLIFGIGGTLAQIVPLILFPLYTNYLTPEEYGVLDIIIRVSEIINTVFLIGGIRLAVMTFYKQAANEEERRHIAITVSLLLWFAVTVSIVMSVYFVNIIEIFFKTGDTRLLAFGLITVLLEPFVGVPMTLLQARLESTRFVLTNLLILLLRLILCIIFVAGFRFGVWGVLYAQMLINILAGVYLNFQEFRVSSLRPDMSKWKEIFFFALPLVPNGILSFIFYMSDRFFLLHFGPYPTAAAAMGACGIYALADRLASFTLSLGASPLTVVWKVKMYDVYPRTDAPFVFGNFIFRLLCVQMFFALGVSVFANEVVRTVCDQTYQEAAVLVPVFAAIICITLLGDFMFNTFYITRHTNYNFICNLTVVPFMLALVYFLVPRWGVIGAAAGLLIGRCLLTAVIFAVTQRFFKIRYPFGKLTVLIGITAICFVLSIYCGQGIELNTMPADVYNSLSKWQKLADAFGRVHALPFCLKGTVLGLWCAAVWFSGIVSRDDKDFILQMLRKVVRKTGVLR